MLEAIYCISLLQQTNYTMNIVKPIIFKNKSNDKAREVIKLHINQ